MHIIIKYYVVSGHLFERSLFSTWISLVKLWSPPACSVLLSASNGSVTWLLRRIQGESG